MMSLNFSPMDIREWIVEEDDTRFQRPLCFRHVIAYWEKGVLIGLTWGTGQDGKLECRDCLLESDKVL